MSDIAELVFVNAGTGETATITGDVVAEQRRGHQIVGCIDQPLPDWILAPHTTVEVVAARTDGTVECSFTVAHQTTESLIPNTHKQRGSYHLFWKTSP